MNEPTAMDESRIHPLSYETPWVTTCRPTQIASTDGRFLPGALGEKNGVALRALNKYGHHASREVEWNLVELFVLLNQGLFMKIGAI